MTTSLVIRDVDGKVINIGEWDYMGEVSTEVNGEIVYVPANPLPEGATQAQEEIVTTTDGGLAAASEEAPSDSGA